MGTLFLYMSELFHNLKKKNWPHLVASGILVPQPGIKPLPPAVEAQTTRDSLDHQGIPHNKMF